jgi:hypothetical protein
MTRNLPRNHPQNELEDHDQAISTKLLDSHLVKLLSKITEKFPTVFLIAFLSSLNIFIMFEENTKTLNFEHFQGLDAGF